MPDQTGGPFDLARITVGLQRDGAARLIPNRPGPPARVDGLSIGAPVMSRPAPHAGEMHPDGDEILYLVSGRLTVVLELQGGPREFGVVPGQAVVVPRGVWHRVIPEEPSQLVHITPGPRGEHRPLAPDAPA